MLLVALAWAAALVGGATTAHVHEEEASGIYDEQHVYVSLDTVSGVDGPLAPPPLVARLLPVFTGVRPRSTSRSLARSGVPPPPARLLPAERRARLVVVALIGALCPRPPGRPSAHPDTTWRSCVMDDGENVGGRWP